MKISWQLATVNEKIKMTFPMKLLLMKIIFSIYSMVIQDLAIKVMIRNSRWPSFILVKTIQMLLLQNHWADLADILHEAYGAPPYIK